MKTSNIKKVTTIRPYNNKYGSTTYYHNLVMENGDKINIGKKREYTEGEELNYEVIESGQQEYDKAKSVNPEFKGNNNFTNKSFKKDDNTQDMIIKQVCLKAAVELCTAYIGQGNKISIENVLDIKNKFYNDLVPKPKISKKIEKAVDMIDEAFGIEDNDLPF